MVTYILREDLAKDLHSKFGSSIKSSDLTIRPQKTDALRQAIYAFVECACGVKFDSGSEYNMGSAGMLYKAPKKLHEASESSSSFDDSSFEH